MGLCAQRIYIRIYHDGVHSSVNTPRTATRVGQHVRFSLPRCAQNHLVLSYAGIVLVKAAMRISLACCQVLRMNANWIGKQAHNYPNVDSPDYNSLIARLKHWNVGVALEAPASHTYG